MQSFVLKRLTPQFDLLKWLRIPFTDRISTFWNDPIFHENQIVEFDSYKRFEFSEFTLLIGENHSQFKIQLY